jgi:serine/threonine-protein kinase
MRGDEAAARLAFAGARAEIEPVLQENPTDAVTLALLAITDAGLGHEEDASRDARSALEIIGKKKGPTKAPRVGCLLAVAYAWLGQRDLAFSSLDPLVDKPAGVVLLDQPTYGDFLLNPVWDPLRDDPRFAALLKRLLPKATP